MAITQPGGRARFLVNPWGWMALGVILCGGGWFWISRMGEHRPEIRFGLVVGGLLAAGLALVIRLNFSPSPFLPGIRPALRKLLLFLLAGLCGIMALSITLLLVLSFLEWENIPWRWGPILLGWLVMGPLNALACRHCVQRMLRNEPLDEREEGAILLFLAALASFFSIRALFEPADPSHLDGIRLFLGVVTLAGLVGAPLALVTRKVRHAVISLLILLHFGGICTACLAISPSPPVIFQLWMRIYRPYLEFTYLNNAYHFYAPEPGPPSYLWFRIIFENQEGETFGQWFKVPKMDEAGWHGHSLGLLYQRYMALTENTNNVDSPVTFFTTTFGAVGPAPFYERRLFHTPEAARRPIILGISRPQPEVTIPFHPDLTQIQQYHPPTALVKEVLASYVRHVAGQAHWPDSQVKSVKVYRVVHFIPAPAAYVSGLVSPDDPDTFRPIFLGEYDPQGKLLDPDEPFLYWILPTLRENPQSPTPRFVCHARKHAGDQNYVRNEKKKWIDPEGVRGQ